MNLELFDIQGIVGRGYGKHPAAAYLLLEVDSRVLARRWLAEQVARARCRGPAHFPQRAQGGDDGTRAQPSPWG
jgi:hypothetical protein